MPSYKFLQVDVFTDVPFGGNPLAVFPDAVGLTGQQMQQLALECNTSETTFVLPPQTPGADFKVRIFTPTAEIPFAGHPLVGTHWVLAHLGRVALAEPVTEVTFELGVGLRTARLHVADGQVTRVVTDHQAPEFLAVASQEQTERLAAALRLPAAAILDTGKPVQAVSTGYPQLFVPLRSLAEVQSIDAIGLDVPALSQAVQRAGPARRRTWPSSVWRRSTPIVTSTCASLRRTTASPKTRPPARPAAGWASYLVHHGLVLATPPLTTIITEQGSEMRRPSKVTVEVEGTADAISMVRVSGDVVLVMEGTFEW